MTKYYRVKKETPVWLEGAIISNEKNAEKYYTIDDLWDTGISTKTGLRYYEGASVVEGCPDWYERVYKNKFDKFLSKAEALISFKEGFRE